MRAAQDLLPQLCACAPSTARTRFSGTDSGKAGSRRTTRYDKRRQRQLRQQLAGRASSFNLTNRNRLGDQARSPQRSEGSVSLTARDPQDRLALLPLLVIGGCCNWF